MELKEGQRDAWRTIQRSHAVANGVFVASPNRIGRGGRPRLLRARRSSRGPSAASSPTRARTARRSSSPTATSPRSSAAARAGPSCATAGSTPTAASRARWLDGSSPEAEGRRCVASRRRGTRGRRSRRCRRRRPPRLGYAMPAEWERHAGTWLAWPHDPVTFRDLVPGRVPVREHGGRRSRRASGCTCWSRTPTSSRPRARRSCSRSGTRPGARRHGRASRSTACRRPTRGSATTGPTFVVRRVGRGPRRAFVRWRFNAWGGKYATLLAGRRHPRPPRPRASPASRRAS